MAAGYAMQDKVAIIGIGRTPYARDLRGRTTASLGFEAAVNAMKDAGLSKNDINGICGTYQIEFEDLQEGLGIPETTWTMNLGPRQQQSHQLAYAAAAVFSGQCVIALVVYAARTFSSSTSRDHPFAKTVPRGQNTRTPVETSLEFGAWWAHVGDAYGAFGNRYMYEYQAPRNVYGLIAVNSRTNASKNPMAVMRVPITMEDYLSARMIREPFGMLDFDVPVDFGNALVVTTVEHARALGLDKRMAVIHAATFGEMAHGTNYYEQTLDYRHLSTWVVTKSLWQKSDLKPKDMDIYFPYDGYTFIAVPWIEAAGFCGPGEAWPYLQQQWVMGENRLKLNGRTYVNTNGGSLSEGATQGANYIYEGVLQLRGEAGAERQVPNCRNVLLTIGGIFHNSTGMVLRKG